jgi:cyclopropane-fatty-acyl-phospholipid synthase
MFLWTGCYGFHENTLQAYHLVAQKRPDRGPRPNPWKRTYNFVHSLV